MTLSLGYNWKVEKLDDGTFHWLVYRFGRPIARGSAPDQKSAESRVWKAMKQAGNNSGGRDRGRARTNLRYLLQSRPYLVAGVTELILDSGASKEQCMKEAAEAERAWWKNEPKETRQPLPTHHLTKPADEVAEKLYECFALLGYLKPGDDENPPNTRALRSWANRILGGAFASTSPSEKEDFDG